MGGGFTHIPDSGKSADILISENLHPKVPAVQTNDKDCENPSNTGQL